MNVKGMDAIRPVYTEQITVQKLQFKNNPDTKNHDMENRKIQPISEKEVIGAIESANKAFSEIYRRFEFSIHEKTKQIMVKVIDTETNEIIREIPPEKVLDMVATIWEMAGILVDERR